MRLPSFLVLLVCFVPSSLLAAEPPLAGAAAELYRKARAGHWFTDAEKLRPDLLPTSDGKSFLVVWKASQEPKHWIVSLHGSEGFATDDLAVWHPHLKNRDVGVLCVQWWLGSGDARDAYYSPETVYREIDLALQKLAVKPGTVLFHGFSRGSANSYAVAALDAGRGKHYFDLAVASSGGVSLDYPPTRAILDGSYGDHPLQHTRWVTAAGGRERFPERDGIPAMKRTAAWLKEQGATVLLSIEDPSQGHGALVLNPMNMKQVLDLFLGESR